MDRFSLNTNMLENQREFPLFCIQIDSKFPHFEDSFPGTNSVTIHHFCIIRWFPALEKSILEKQVTRTPPPDLNIGKNR